MNWSDRYPALQKIFEKFQKMWLFAMTSVFHISYLDIPEHYCPNVELAKV